MQGTIARLSVGLLTDDVKGRWFIWALGGSSCHACEEECLVDQNVELFSIEHMQPKSFTCNLMDMSRDLTLYFAWRGACQFSGCTTGDPATKNKGVQREYGQFGS